MKVTIKFVDDSGDQLVATLDDANAAFAADNGVKGTFVRRTDAFALDIKGDWTGTIMFAGDRNLAVGHTTRYTVSDGRAGTSTILAIE